jgi:SAM-dependent methyltransferase
MSKRCPVCRLTDINRYIGLYVQCSTCRALYLRRMPSSSYLTRAIHTFEQSVFTNVNDKKIISVYVRRLHDLSLHIPPKAAILDVGSGNGIFLSVARQAGFTVEAMDISGICVRKARQMKFTAYTDLRMVPDHTYDAITLFDVIEHIPDPKTFLSIVSTKLKRRGILMITTPNNQGITALMVPSYLTAGDGMYSGHVVLYAPPTLILLLHPEFEALKTKTDILLQWSHSNHVLRNKVINKFVYLMLTPVLPFLFSLRRGDNIQIIAKKV